MEFNYDGKHQVSFWKMTYLPWESSWECDAPRYSWDDLHLIPSAVPTVEIPKPNYSIVSIPGTSLRRDVTEYLPGGMTYSSVSGKWTFIVDHTQWGDEKSWIAVHRGLEDYFDGERFAVELTDDPGVLYSGRVWISDHEAGDNYSTVTIEYDFGVGEFDFLDGFYFKIRFLDFNGEVLQEELMKYGEMPVYYRQRPEKGGAEFIGWEPEITPVSGTADYTAIYEYEGRSHSIIFYDAAGNVIHEEYDVPDWMKFVHYTMHPLIEMMGPRNVLLNNMYRKPENMEFYSMDDLRVASIKIVVPPDKLGYIDGETMDYTGIVVKKYDFDGNLIGTIPFDELIFPIKKAEYIGHEDYNNYVDQYRVDRSLLHYPDFDYQIYYIKCLKFNQYADGLPNGGYTLHFDREVYGICYNRRYWNGPDLPDQQWWLFYSSVSFMWCRTKLGEEASWENAFTSSKTYSKNTIISYYSLTSGWGPDGARGHATSDYDSIPKLNISTTGLPSGMSWDICYLTMGENYTVPVQWIRPADEAILEDTFEIVVNPDG